MSTMKQKIITVILCSVIPFSAFVSAFISVSYMMVGCYCFVISSIVCATTIKRIECGKKPNLAAIGIGLLLSAFIFSFDTSHVWISVTLSSIYAAGGLFSLIKSIIDYARKKKTAHIFSNNTPSKTVIIPDNIERTTYSCTDCKKEITDPESEWVHVKRYCKDCAKLRREQHLRMADKGRTKKQISHDNTIPVKSNTPSKFAIPSDNVEKEKATYSCTDCEKEITDQESEWVHVKRYCKDCAKLRREQHLRMADKSKSNTIKHSYTHPNMSNFNSLYTALFVTQNDNGSYESSCVCISKETNLPVIIHERIDGYYNTTFSLTEELTYEKARILAEESYDKTSICAHYFYNIDENNWKKLYEEARKSVDSSDEKVYDLWHFDKINHNKKPVETPKQETKSEPKPDEKLLNMIEKSIEESKVADLLLGRSPYYYPDKECPQKRRISVILFSGIHKYFKQNTLIQIYFENALIELINGSVDELLVAFEYIRKQKCNEIKYTAPFYIGHDCTEKLKEQISIRKSELENHKNLRYFTNFKGSALKYIKEAENEIAKKVGRDMYSFSVNPKFEAWSEFKETLPHRYFEKYESIINLPFLTEIIEVDSDKYGGTNREYYFDKKDNRVYTKLHHWNCGNMWDNHSYNICSLKKEELIDVFTKKKNEILAELSAGEKTAFKKISADILNFLLIQYVTNTKHAPAMGNDFGQCGESAYWEYNASNNTFTIFGSGSIKKFENINDYLRRTQYDPHNLGQGYENPAFNKTAAPENTIEIIIPENITNIESMAFLDFKNLQTVFLPESIETISNYTFSPSAVDEITFYVYRDSKAESIIDSNGWKKKYYN